MKRAFILAVGAAIASLLSVAAPAGAATSATGLYISGAGDGHGIGMSQYGAGGFAAHGFSDTYILQHYYHDTTIGNVSPTTPVTVLLKDGEPSFKGATTITGSTTTLTPTKTYKVTVSGSKLKLSSGSTKVGTFTPPLIVSGSGPLDFIGLGNYDGSFVFRPDGNKVQTVNSLGLDDYVQGVVAAEMPSTWGMAALEAQAIAARTYVLTTDAAPGDFQAYSNTRSQMYLGIRGETPSTNQAVQNTSGQVVEYDGAPVVTYYFASSGGYTESIQNVWSVAPEAWLIGEPDPYDDYANNPYYRWHVVRKLTKAKKALKGLFKGTFEGIRTLQHGVSPRIVTASVVGTKGSSTVTGAKLQTLFGTMSTYMSFTTISERSKLTSAAASKGTGTTTTGTTTTGTTTATTPVGTTTKVHWALTGSIYPVANSAAIVAQRQTASGWVTIGTAHLTAAGKYTIPVPQSGVYRVHYATIYGTPISVK